MQQYAECINIVTLVLPALKCPLTKYHKNQPMMHVVSTLALGLNHKRVNENKICCEVLYFSQDNFIYFEKATRLFWNCPHFPPHTNL